MDMMEQKNAAGQVADENLKVEILAPAEDTPKMNENNSSETEKELPLEDRVKVCFYCQFYAKDSKCSLTSEEPKFLGKQCRNFVENPKAKKHMRFILIWRSIMSALLLIGGVSYILLNITDLSYFLAGKSSDFSPFNFFWGLVLISLGIISAIGVYRGYKLNKER